VQECSTITKAPQTLLPCYINATEVFDLQQAVRTLKQELFDEHCKLLQEKKTNRQLQSWVYQYTVACIQSIEDNNQMIYHCQVLSNQNITLSNEYEKSKLIVQTLEAVIQTVLLPSNGYAYYPGRGGGDD
jgi:hypothetical protein